MSEEATQEVTSQNSAEETSKTSKSSGVQLPAFYGQKAGMTRIFDEQGKHIPVTVIKLIPNYITQVKTADKDGYEAYQIGYYGKREKLVNKPTKGRLSKAKVADHLTRFAEVKVNDPVDAANLGKEVSLDGLEQGTYVDISGVTKGKGFQGVIKRHNFAGGPASHGHKFHRSTGSIGQCASPARVWKNKKMPGHMGVKNQTVQNLQVVELNTKDGYLLIKGSVPGGKNGFVKVSRAIKKA